jgi:type I restriction enzyme M protein
VSTTTLIQQLWNYCNALRDDGISYGDYVEQLSYRLVLKIADERSRLPYNQASLIREPYAWPALQAIAYHIRKRISYITPYQSISCNHHA